MPASTHAFTYIDQNTYRFSICFGMELMERTHARSDTKPEQNV